MYLAKWLMCSRFGWLYCQESIVRTLFWLAMSFAGLYQLPNVAAPLLVLRLSRRPRMAVSHLPVRSLHSAELCRPVANNAISGAALHARGLHHFGDLTGQQIGPRTAALFTTPSFVQCRPDSRGAHTNRAALQHAQRRTIYLSWLKSTVS